MTNDQVYPTVLLVEDDFALRMVLEMALSDEGFEVVAASSGKAAMIVLGSGGPPFDALLSDIRLGPGPDGWDVARRGREVAADIPVIYMSGDSMSLWPTNGVPDSVMLQKPVQINRLTEALSFMLSYAAVKPERMNQAARG